MKRFTILALLLLTVGVGASLAAMPDQDEVVKIEVGVVNDALNDVTTTPGVDYVYVAEPSGETLTRSRAPAVIGKIHDAYQTTIFKPPVLKNNRERFKYSKRH